MESIWRYNKVILWFVISKNSNYCQIAEANSPLNLKPCSLALLSLLQKGQHQLKIKELFPILITTIHNYERKNIIEEEAKIWESENLWQGYISSPSHASLSIPPSQPEDNISFKATPTVFSQQIQNSPDAGPPPHPPRRVASLPSGFPPFPPERLKLLQTEQKIIQCQTYTCGSLITIWFVIGQLIPTEFHLCISAS